MTVTLDPLAYYSTHGAALFPIPAGSKNPTGIVESFKHDHSRDPAQWEKWRVDHPGCNFGVVGFASGWIIVDIDVNKIGRDTAWSLWCELCVSWGIEPANPHVQSARGGWHVYFVIPHGVDPYKLRQPDAIKDIVNIRCIGYVVGAGSFYDGSAKGEQSGTYTLLSDNEPYLAPAGLVEHCSRRPERKQVTKVGTLESEDVKAFLAWMVDRNQFASYEDWVHIGMALKIEFGDAGFELWKETFDDEEQTADLAEYKWDTFSGEADGNSITLLSFMKRANELGWKGSIRKSMSAMFGGVAQIAAAAGANLSSGPSPGLPMMEGQAELARLGAPYLQDFLDSTSDSPISPSATNLPALPAAMNGHGLYDLMGRVIPRIFALADMKPWKPNRIARACAVLALLQADVYSAVARRLEDMGFKVPHREIKREATRLGEDVERVTVTGDKWERDPKTQRIESDNPDNMRFGLEYLGLEIRFNAWTERMQVKGFMWERWTNLDDAVVVALLTRWRQTKTRFCPGKEFTWETLEAIARENTQDPVLNEIAELESKWDRTPRLDTWLSRYCGTPDDLYHRAVSKLIVGGIVQRARRAGEKFDFMPVFYGPQGTGKSTLARLLALRLDWFNDTIQLGDQSKELILSLAGKLVIEISEMGMRSNTNANQVKAMISRQVDAGRTAYARTVSERQRRNIFIGTTNDDTPLSDPTGNRRFLPIRIDREIDLAGVRADIGQLIGEAAALQTAGENFDLHRDVWSAASGYQEHARSASDLEIYFYDWFGEDSTTSAFVTVADLVRLCDATGRKNAGALANSIMPKLGFKQINTHVDGKRSRLWMRGVPMGNNLAGYVNSLPRFNPDLSSASPRVVMRMAAGVVPRAMGPPPIPQR